MLTLFHAPQSRSSRLLWLIEELGADCRVEYCDIRRMDGTGAPDPKNPHPDGKVPALLHDGALITESAAVALYLNGLYPGAGLGFEPGSPRRGPLLTWICWSTGEMEPAILDKLTGAVDTNPMALARYDAAVTRILEALWEGPWLMGDQFTLADILIGGSLGWCRQYLPESPLLDDYIARLAARPAHHRAMLRDAAPGRAEAA